MLNIGSVRKDQYLKFIQKRIETNEIDFHAPKKQKKLHTFESSVANVRKVKGKRKEAAGRSERDTFARSLNYTKKLVAFTCKKVCSMTLLLSLLHL